MATLTATTTAAPSQPHSTTDPTAATLARLLTRLESILLNPIPSNTPLRRLRASAYERNRVGANIEHARALLFRLEHNGPATSDRRAAVRAQRSRLRKLQAALDEVGRLSSSTASPADDEEEEAEVLRAPDAEELVARFADGVTPPSSSSTTSNPATSTTAAATSTIKAAPTDAAPSTLRARRPLDTATSTATATATGSAFSGGGKQTGKDAAKDAGKRADATQLLEAHDAEQTSLTDSLVALAGALRQSTQSFAAELEGSNPLVDVAAAALDRNVGGLAKAGQRMGSLRRMTEGKGWLARMGLYGWVAALWVALILLVFVAPKLRF